MNGNHDKYTCILNYVNKNGNNEHTTTTTRAATTVAATTKQ